jgi:hypothetical protein
MRWATFLAIFPQTHLVTLLAEFEGRAQQNYFCSSKQNKF